MKAGTVSVLVVLGVLALGGGWYFGPATTPGEKTAVSTGQLMFPDLASKLKDAAKIEITHQGKQTIIEKRPDGGWGVASMHDYPVQESKLRGLLTGLTELRLIEARTTDPSQFSRLGLDDPNGAGSTADLLAVSDTSGKAVLAVIVGHKRVRSQANAPEELYVRRPDENQTWLAEGNVQADADPTMWLDRSILNIPHDQITSVVVGDQALTFGKVDGKIALTQPADHPKLEDYKVDDVGRALESLTMQNVAADADVTAQEAGHSVFTTEAGLAVRVAVLHDENQESDKKVWARFGVGALSDKAKNKAEQLQGRLAGWTFEIGSWKEKSLVPTIDDLKAAEPAKPSSAPENQ